MKASELAGIWIGTREGVSRIFLGDMSRCICGDHIREAGIKGGSVRDTWHAVREILEENGLWQLEKLAHNLRTLCQLSTSEVSIGGLGIGDEVQRTSWLHVSGHELNVTDLLFIIADMMLSSPKDPE